MLDVRARDSGPFTPVIIFANDLQSSVAMETSFSDFFANFVQYAPYGLHFFECDVLPCLLTFLSIFSNFQTFDNTGKKSASGYEMEKDSKESHYEELCTGMA